MKAYAGVGFKLDHHAEASMPAALQALLTADEFYAVAGRKNDRFELVRGEVRPTRPTSGGHGTVSMNLVGRLWLYVDQHELGQVFGDNVGFVLPLPPEMARRSLDGELRDTVRSPDAAFVRRERIPAGGFGEGWVRLAPDFAVEVLSPDETATETDEKLEDYRAAGTALLWVVHPGRRRVTVHAAHAPTRWVHSGDTLDGGDVIPGFTIAVDVLFKNVPAR